MLRKMFDIDLVDADANGIATTQTLSAADCLTLNGALVSGGTVELDYARKISITSVGNDSGLTFTVTGTDSDSKTQTEDITGPNAATVASTKYFLTVTSICTDGATAGDVSSGTVDEAVTSTYPLDRYSDSPASVGVTVTGTIDFTVQETFDDVQADSQNAVYYDSSIADATASATNTLSVGASAVQLVVNSYSSGAELQFHVAQPGAG